MGNRHLTGERRGKQIMRVAIVKIPGLVIRASHLSDKSGEAHALNVR